MKFGDLKERLKARKTEPVILKADKQRVAVAI